MLESIATAALFSSFFLGARLGGLQGLGAWELGVLGSWDLESPNPESLHPPKGKPKPLYPTLNNLLDPLIHLSRIPVSQQRYAGPQHQFDALHLTLCQYGGTCLAYLPCYLHAAQPLSVQTVLPSLYPPLHSPHSQTPHAIFGPIISNSQREHLRTCRLGTAPRMFSKWQSVVCEQS